MRLSYDGGWNYPRKLERGLTPEPPPVPAAVYVYDDQGDTRVLAADFDVKRAAGRGAADPVAQVAADAAALASLVRACGGRGFGDVSPNGGRHGYVLWAAPLPYSEMRRVALALARRYPSLDPTPMLGREHGIIRPPGSRHRSGGHQALTTPLEHAVKCATEPNGPAVWERLLDALSADLEAVDRGESGMPGGEPEPAPDRTGWRLDPAGMPWLVLEGGRVPALREDLELTAVTGGYDTALYATPSEARMAILCSAAARGWQLGEVAERVRSGSWEGLAGFYARYRPGQRAKSLAADWRKAVSLVARRKTGRGSHTSLRDHRGGIQPHCDLASPGADRNRHGIRQWNSAMLAGEQDGRWPGAHGITVRLVLRGLAAAAVLGNSMTIEFGTRSLGLLCNLDHSTVAKVLRELRAEPEPFVDLIEAHRGLRGDLYQLRIPDRYVTAAAWRRWKPGRLGVHPVFRVLGGVAALTWEQLAGEPVMTCDLQLLAGASATAVSEALCELAEHGLAERVPGGWRRGPVTADEAAARLSVPELIADLQERYRRERAEWRGLIMLARSPVADVGDIPWPEQAPADEDVFPALASVRGPPPDLSTDEGVLALLEQHLGPVEVISVA
jgi:hypothetical protein